MPQTRFLLPVLAAAGAALTLAVPVMAAPPAVDRQPRDGATTLSVASQEQTFTVPDGITSLHVILVGAPGGTAEDGTGRTGGEGGTGAVVTADLAVTPGDVLYVQVGEAGELTAGGYNGGGDGSTALLGSGISRGGGGGGATDIRTVSCGSSCATGGDSTSQASRLIVAGGGGGGGSASSGTFTSSGFASGGDGGDAGEESSGNGRPGADGGDTNSDAGGGEGGGAGTTSAAGLGGAEGAHQYPNTSTSTPGSGGAGGNGGENLASGAGGGGAGYFGGGGGGPGGNDMHYAEGGAGGGGAGSSWADPTRTSNVTIEANTDPDGETYVEISYELPTDSEPEAQLDLSIGGSTIPADSQGRIPLTQGASFTVSGSGLQPGSTVAVEVRSTPVLLARPLVGVLGSFSTVVTLPDDLAPGDHTLIATGVDVNGDPVVASVALVVAAALPATGTALTPIILTGVGSVLLGVLALVGVRRRRA